jgi:hypothetical protein
VRGEVADTEMCTKNTYLPSVTTRPYEGPGPLGKEGEPEPIKREESSRAYERALTPRQPSASEVSKDNLLSRQHPKRPNLTGCSGCGYEEEGLLPHV